MNLLAYQAAPDYEAWKADFDAHAETRANAGLTLLQLWRDVDGPGVTALYDVNDGAKARAWLETESATGGPIDARFVRTA